MTEPQNQQKVTTIPVLAIGVALVLFLAVGSGSGCTQTSEGEGPTSEMSVDPQTTAELSEQLQSLLDDFVAGQTNVRSGILLVESPGFRWKGASGVAVEAAGVPILPDDQFAIDSIAKMMTATIVMKLVESGRLGLDDRIADYLPEALMDGLHVYEGRSYSDEIAVRHLLNHSSGIPDDWNHPEFLDLILADLERRWTPLETVEFVKEKGQSTFPPGGGFTYSDVGYNLLGLIIEAVTDKELHQVYRELLLDPLSMDHTYRPEYEQARPSIPGRVPSERYFGDLECSLTPAVMSADWAGGGLISTAEDLNRFLRAFVRDEIFEKSSTRQEILRWIESGPYHGYGFGVSRVEFDRSDNPGHAALGEVWGHAGSSDNFMFYWPSRRLIMIGTLNQIDSERSLYDILAAIMRTVQQTTAEKNLSGETVR